MAEEEVAAAVAAGSGMEAGAVAAAAGDHSWLMLLLQATKTRIWKA